MPLVKELMKKDVITISADATIKDAILLMKKRKVQSLVIDKKSPSDAYGIITFADIAKAVIAERGNMEMLNVFDAASKPAVQVSESMDAKYAVRLMFNFGFKQVLVVDNNELKGILSLTDAVFNLINSG
jgi:CBS domain-containing protein